MMGVAVKVLQLSVIPATCMLLPVAALQGLIGPLLMHCGANKDYC